MEAKRFILVALLLVSVVGICESFEFHEEDLASEEKLWDLYERWRSHHTVSRDLGEKQKRFNVFKQNVMHIHKVNKQDRAYKLKLNKFAHMTNHEFRSMFAGSKVGHHRMFRGSHRGSGRFMHENVTAVPTSVDWRAKGAVTDVKDQGRCGKLIVSPAFTLQFHLIHGTLVYSFLSYEGPRNGIGFSYYQSRTGSCWAFSTVVAVEGVNYLKTNKLVALSEQELIDCDTAENQGCNGGLMDYAFEYIKQKGGITSESNYPYQASDGKCDASKVFRTRCHFCSR